jgi:hypothetical protein
MADLDQANPSAAAGKNTKLAQRLEEEEDYV